MSAHIPCSCKGTRKEKMKNWYLPKAHVKTNYSYFQYPKGQAHFSEYSTIYCSKCLMYVRSKAKFINKLPIK